MLKRLPLALSNLSALLMAATLVLAPLPFGSLDSHWQAVWCVLLAASLMIAPLPPLSRISPFVWAAIALLALFALVAWAQTRAPSALLPAHPAWASASAALGRKLAEHRSALVSGPLDPLLMPLLFTLTFVRVSLFCQTGADVRQLLAVLRVAILATGFLAALAWWADPSHLLGEPKLYYRRAFTGTFVNANTAASYYGFGTLLWLAHALERGLKAPARRMSGWRGRFLQLSDGLTLQTLGAPAAALACLALVAMTGSRAGLALTVLPGAVMVVCTSELRLSRGLVLGGAAAALAALLIVPSALFDRLATGGLWDGYRLEVYRLCLKMIGAAPLLGHGAGAFEHVFPLWRSEALGMYGVWDHAHSGLLELAVEMGVPFALALTLAWGAALLVLARRGRAACAGGPRMAPLLAGPAVAVLGTAHSLVDFPLQVAGTLVVFAAIAAAGLASSDAPEQHSGPRLPHSNESWPPRMTKVY